jgi:signal transduction histidine kinase
MNQEKKAYLSLNTGTDLAFALVVFISFFTIFSSAPITNPLLILVIIFLGVAYITIGIYGFSYAQASPFVLPKLLYFVVQLLLGGLIVYLGRGAGINALVLLPLVAHTAMLLDQDRMLIVNGAIIATYFLSVLAYSKSLTEVWQGTPFFFTGQVVILIFTQMAVTELRARVKLENLAGELSEANKNLSEYASRVKDLTIIQERNRLAREIHDGLGHYLTIINMQLKAATAVINKDNKKAEKMIESATHLSSEALIDVRNSVFALRQDTIDIKPLGERLMVIAESSSSKEQRVSVKIIGKPRDITPKVDLTLYRAGQEMINNAVKHSQAREVILTLDYTDRNNILLTSQDNGIGNNPINQGFGLLGINERVRLLNGEVEIRTSQGEGFMLKIKIPSNHGD